MYLGRYHISKKYLRYLSHLQHTYAVSQILKASTIYVSHSLKILALSQISKSFNIYLSRFSNTSAIFHIL